MRPLATEFRKDGYAFRQLDRLNDVALFEKTSGAVVSWEVVVVQKHPERTIAGRLIPAAEAMPPAESWGQKGWTLTTHDRALEKMVEVLAREAERETAKVSA